MKGIWRTMICAVCAAMILPACALAEAEGSAGTAVDLTGVIVALAALAFDVMMAWAAKNCLPEVRVWLEERTTESQRRRIYELIDKLVNAAEQVMGAGCGSEKMKYVIAGLNERGVKVDVALIEAAVKEMNDRAMERIEKALVTAEPVSADGGPGGA